MTINHASLPGRPPRRLRASRRPPLSIAQILAWADEFFDRTGRWPTAVGGRIRQSSGDSWESVDRALRVGLRGLTRGSSLARVLSEHRGVRNKKDLPAHTIEGILAWADAHRLRTGKWPSENAGPVVDAPGETWSAVTAALWYGTRGLPGGSSLARLLTEHRGARNLSSLPRLSVQKILTWADAFRKRIGRWPTKNDGPIPESGGETWTAVDLCLIRGRRGLRGGQSLAQLLHERRGVRNRKALPPFTQRQILAWADAYRERSGRWPTLHSGPIAEAPGETWGAIQAALQQGSRGLRGGSTLAKLLHQCRDVSHKGLLPRFSKKAILAWARAHRRRTGKFPRANSGPIAESPGDTWMAVNMALHKGHRGLPGGSSLAKLLNAGKTV